MRECVCCGIQSVGMMPNHWYEIWPESGSKKHFQEAVEQLEKDPNGLNAKEPGSKLDDGKSPIFQGAIGYFPRAIRMVSNVSLFGAKKYSWRGWESVPDGFNRYSDALARHLVSEQVEGEIDEETGLYHAAQVAWNALARLELMLKEKENGSRN